MNHQPLRPAELRGPAGLSDEQPLGRTAPRGPADLNDDNHTRGNNGLDRIYLNTRHPAGYSTPSRLWRAYDHKVSRKKVDAYLQGQDTYTLHKPARRRFPRNITYADTIDACWQADLADFQQLKEDNDDFMYVLFIIDVLSKFLWCIPLKNKKAGTVMQAFKLLFTQTDRRPGHIITDKGGELNNATLKKFLEENGIEYYHTENPDTKCAVVERVIRTIRQMMQKVFTHREKYRYIDGVLADVTHAYNHKAHRSIGMTPTEASNPKRTLEVYNKLYGGKLNAKKVTPKLKVGDYVRISREKKRFEKGHTWNWSEEIFQITKVIPHIQPVYRIADLDKKEIKGHFYSWELSKVEKPELFKIAYIVRKRGPPGKRECFVHWRGYPASARSWVRERDIFDK
jgi:hypothetical protein